MASAVIGALRVNLGLNSAEFQRGMKQARTGLRRFGRQIRRGLALAAVGATASLGGVAVAVRGVLDEADELAKTARKLGLPVEELQRFRHAAELSGVDARTLEMGLQRFTRRTSEAANGMGEARAALAEMGIQLRDTNGNMRPTSDLLDDVADAMAAIESPADRVRVMVKLFDSEALGLVNMLIDGSAALRLMKKEADDFGGVISGRTAAAAEAFHDNLTRLRGIFRGLVNTIAERLAPHLVTLTDKLVANKDQIGEMAERLGELLPALFDLAVQVGGPLIEALTRFAEDLVKVAEELRATWQAAVEMKDRTVAAFVELVDSAVEMKDRTVAAFVELRDSVLSVIDRVLAKIREAKDAFLDFIGATKGQAGLAAVASDLDKALGGQAEKTMRKQVEEIEKGSKDSVSVFEEGARGMIGVAKELDDALVGNSIIPDMVDDIITEFRRLRGETRREVEANAEEVTGEFGQMATSMLDPLKEAFREGELRFESFGEALLGIGRRLADRLIDEAFKPIESAIAALFGGGGSIFGRSILGGGGGGAASAFIAALPTTIAGFAEGGFARGLALVGEEGPELVNFGSRGARVFSHDDSRRMLGSSGLALTQHFDMRGANVSETRMRQIAEDASRRGVASLIEARRESKQVLA